jgi:hypothetical protein
MKTLILAAVTALSLGTSVLTAQAAQYHTPPHNFYQNNWMTGE